MYDSLCPLTSKRRSNPLALLWLFMVLRRNSGTIYQVNGWSHTGTEDISPSYHFQSNSRRYGYLGNLACDMRSSILTFDSLQTEAHIPNSEMKRPARMSQLCHDSWEPFTKNGQLKQELLRSSQTHMPYIPLVDVTMLPVITSLSGPTVGRTSMIIHVRRVFGDSIW
jgi:hypothetical protein